jgi:hypothetical protein
LFEFQETQVNKACFSAFLLFAVTQAVPAAQPAGQFQDSSDIGVTPRKGAVAFDSAAGRYRITGGGANMWNEVDAFHYVFSRISGDVTVTADVQFEGTGAVEHRKAVLMVRQSLEPNAAYADVALHGDGLTSLQYRSAAGQQTEEVQSAIKGPVRIRIKRRGDLFTMYAGNPGGPLTPSGPVELKLQDPVYVGLGVCSHDANVLETAVFSNVEVDVPEPPVRSKISIFDMKTRTAKVLYQADTRLEAPNWSRDGKYLLINSGGKLFRLAVTGGEPVPVEMGDIGAANNDHGISPDGRSYAVSAQKGDEPSKIWVMTPEGKDAKLVTENAPSYYHGWSPDGKWLAYCAEREKNFDIYRVPVEGGPEQRLTSHPGYDDGPDYSPDGKWIYFNSDRSGSWDIWRIPVDGAGPDDKKAERITSDDYEDWFPHPSPDGKRMVFLSFKKGTEGHPPNQDIILRLMPLPPNPKKITVLTHLFGGQGTLNVNSWSPDSKKFAFVSYELIGK